MQDVEKVKDDRPYIPQPHPQSPTNMAKYTSVIPLLIQILEKPTHYRGMVSVERLRVVLQKIMKDVDEKRPDYTDNEK
jgi:hypothetical protein